METRNEEPDRPDETWTMVGTHVTLAILDELKAQREHVAWLTDRREEDAHGYDYLKSQLARARERGTPQEAIEQIARYVETMIGADPSVIAKHIRRGTWQTP